MRFKLSYLLAAGLAGGVALWMSSGTVVIGGVGDGENATPPPAERAAETQGDIFKVRVQTLKAEERQPVLEIRGRTEAEAKVAVRAETTDTVIERPATEGSRVKVGDILCVLDTGPREAKVLEAKANLSQAELDHSAASQLVTKGFTAQTRVAAVQAQLDAARARLKEEELELNRTVIRSPLDGIIESPMANVGDRLQDGDICATVVDLDPMIALGQVSEINVGQISLGMPAEVELVTGGKIKGKVRYIAPAADPDTRTFRVEIELPNKDGKARDGVTAATRLPLPKQMAHKITPAILTLNDTGEVGIRAVDENDMTVFYPVTVLGGEQDGVWVGGLPDEITAIVVGQDYVSDGQKVAPIFDTAEVQ
ncbi:multidrug efflux system membrane fusion protein [Roseibium hamelinense]|uniref:Multidrug efflux system membrane fusion protein n=1 Tax=Roseibium hamelinense TaxID=150831 RepID=A0A562T7Y6_9HYPH|nr:efflux RND transporter periplasmic adaptor subunit [Roseibium hamelinense]MTI43514.1 efflux RND transporter periplasmic adaptor subunit [Roseibium hamelinense]TWI89692.1 multidrug efflux system membrane fusion protein [Roseibium hamelinense]